MMEFFDRNDGMRINNVGQWYFGGGCLLAGIPNVEPVAFSKRLDRKTGVKSVKKLVYAFATLLVTSSAYAASDPPISAASLALDGNITYTGASSAANSLLYASPIVLSGTASAGLNGTISPFNIFLSSDTVDTGNTELLGMDVEHVTQTGSTGNRVAIQGYEVVAGVPGSTNNEYLGINANLLCEANMNGTSGSFTTYQGSCSAGDSNAFTPTGGSNFMTYAAVFEAHEFDVSLATNNSTARKLGISIVQGSTDAVHGVYEDYAIQIANLGGAAGWTDGIMFGGIGEAWPVTSGATLIGAIAQSLPSGPTYTAQALNGVDFSAVQFQSGGCAFKSTNYCVDPSGNIEGRTLIATGTSPVASLNGIYELGGSAVGFFAFGVGVGYINAAGMRLSTGEVYSVGGSNGVSQTCTISTAHAVSGLTLTFTGGILTGGTCNS